MHPTSIEDVAVLPVTARVSPVAPAPPTVKLPVIAVELADAFLMVSPERRVNCVVLAPPRNVASAVAGTVSAPAAEIVVLAVPPKVETPNEFSVGVVSTPAVETVEEEAVVEEKAEVEVGA